MEDNQKRKATWHLKRLQDGTLDDHTYVTSADIGVKL